ncbi:helix-turn-helix transcriptional regulator [Spongiimicrobium salis]|uniref:helix-turn-helix transcriptional regulator n=1 Tax=Spongiimicrobium salis TaxID=1667022 RepID=UPI00374CC88F
MEPNEKPRISRLTAIITQLQSNTLVTAKMLADKHQVSVRTIYRDIRTLERSGVPIVTEEGRGYSLMDGYHLPPIMLSENEANALITAEQLVLKNKDASFVKYYSEAIQKIKATLRKPQKEKSNLLAQRIYVLDNYNYQRTSDYLMLLQSAITNFEVLDIEYHSLQQQQTSRSIEPFALYSSQEKWLLIAFCRLRTAFRVFRIDHIAKIKRTHTHFESHNMTLEEYYKRYIHE